MSSYIIYSIGRTGSTLLTRNINAYFNDDARSHVIHQSNFVHTANLIPWDESMICIRSRRRDLFKTAISMVIAEHTRQADTYDTNIEPFDVNSEYFKSLFSVFTEFYDKIDTSRYAGVFDVYFEDLMSDDKILLKTLGIDKIIDYTLCDKSPHVPENLILNYDELKFGFSQWQKNQDKYQSLAGL